MKTNLYKCESCAKDYNYSHDGRMKTPSGVLLYCTNPECQNYMTRKFMKLVKEETPLTDLQKKLIEESISFYKLACDKLNMDTTELTFKFDLTGDTAGQINTTSGRIRYNLPIAERYTEDFLNQTVKHEIIHIVADRYYKKDCGHKKEWKNLMQFFGLNDSRCHDYDMSQVKGNRKMFKYNCPCNNWYTVGLNLHKKIQSGTSHYCKKCKTKLRDMTYTEV